MLNLLTGFLIIDVELIFKIATVNFKILTRLYRQFYLIFVSVCIGTRH